MGMWRCHWGEEGGGAAGRSCSWLGDGIGHGHSAMWSSMNGRTGHACCWLALHAAVLPAAHVAARACDVCHLACAALGPPTKHSIHKAASTHAKPPEKPLATCSPHTGPCLRLPLPPCPPPCPPVPCLRPRSIRHHARGGGRSCSCSRRCHHVRQGALLLPLALCRSRLRVRTPDQAAAAAARASTCCRRGGRLGLCRHRTTADGQAQQQRRRRQWRRRPGRRSSRGAGRRRALDGRWRAVLFRGAAVQQRAGRLPLPHVRRGVPLVQGGRLRLRLHQPMPCLAMQCCIVARTGSTVCVVHFFRRSMKTLVLRQYRYCQLLPRHAMQPSTCMRACRQASVVQHPVRRGLAGTRWAQQ